MVVNILFFSAVTTIFFFLIPKKEVEDVKPWEAYQINGYLAYGQVEEVINGFKFKAILESGHRVAFCLYGVRTPKVNIDGGVIAKQHLTEFILGRRVLLWISSRTFQGEYQAIVIYESVTASVNGYMVASGYAWVDNDLCIVDEYCRWWRIQQGEAEHELKGFWGYPWIGRNIPDKDIDSIAPYATGR